jgi:hypothetical protein
MREPLFPSWFYPPFRILTTYHFMPNGVMDASAERGPRATANEPERGDLHRIIDSVSAERGDEGDQAPPASVSFGLALFLNITR